MLEEFERVHAGWASNLRKFYTDKEVILKRSQYGKMRRGRIVEVLVGDRVSFGIDVYRTDGGGFCAKRQWTWPAGVVL